MGRTVWYPGHMAKGKRQLEALANTIDFIIEVRDARAPNLSSSPLLDIFKNRIQIIVVLSKADLSEKNVSNEWVRFLKKQDMMAQSLDLRKGNISSLKKEITGRKPYYRDLRLAVVGIPNVGKSILINQLVGRKAALVGGVPGVTKGVSWFSGQGFLLADSPGILDPHSDRRAHRILSWIGSSKGQVIGNYEEHAKECISFMIKKDIWLGVERTWGIKAEGASSDILKNIGGRLGKLLPGGVIDLETSGKIFLEAFATGKFGSVSLEKPNDPPLWEFL